MVSLAGKLLMITRKHYAKYLNWKKAKTNDAPAPVAAATVAGTAAKRQARQARQVMTKEKVTMVRVLQQYPGQAYHLQNIDATHIQPFCVMRNWEWRVRVRMNIDTALQLDGLCENCRKKAARRLNTIQY